MLETNMETQPTFIRPRGRRRWLLGILIVIILLAILWFAGGKDLVLNRLARSTEYQAVFLTNGQVYFGKLATSGDWMKLTDVYYLQVTGQTDQLQQAGDASADTSSPQNIQLVKLGSELHGPTDEMFIEKDKILFWENMKDDSKVLQSIKDYQSKH